MNKNEWIDFIANKTDLTKINIDAVINTFGDAMLETLKNVARHI